MGACAALLQTARLNRSPIDPLTRRYPNLTVEQAYQIQAAGIELRRKAGERVVGFKLGFTSEAKREQMHLHSIIYGVLTHAMKEGASALWIAPKLEVEVAFILGKDIKSPLSREEALAACSGVCTAIEIIDSRYRNFQFTLPDVIADNTSSCAFILSPVIHKPTDIDLRHLEVRLEVDGKIVEKSNTDAISGDPVVSLIQLSQLFAKRGQIIPAGSIVLAGSAIEAIPLQPKMKYAAHIQKLGSAEGFFRFN